MGGAEAKSNIQTAIANARLNDVNKVTPYGTVTYAFGTPVAGQAGAPGGAGGAGGAAAGGAGAAVPSNLAWTNQVRQRLNLPPLIPGTPQYQQWLWNQNRMGGWGGPPGAAGGGQGHIGSPSGGGGGGSFSGPGGVRGDIGAGSHGGMPTM